MATYSSGWIVGYVFAFPIVTFAYLYKRRGEIIGMPRVRHSVIFGFLCDDYRLTKETYLWEALEMTRKLLLACSGAFWGNKSAMCVGTALLISAGFHLLHAHYRPYKSGTANGLQHVCLGTLTLLYFIGLLVKVSHEGTTKGAAVARDDLESIGQLMIVLIVFAIVLVVCAITWEVFHVVKNLRAIRSFARRLSTLNRADPTDDTSDFYAIQNPVMPMDIKLVAETGTFEPRQPPILLPGGRTEGMVS
jgi:hypothetical protein